MPRFSLATGSHGVTGWNLLLVPENEESNPPGYPAPSLEPNPIPDVQITVPGDMHSALIDAGQIPDPYYGKNELDVQWVGTREWIVTTGFDVSRKRVIETRQ
jgi:beta-galactosidase/beta-glucuronidase